MMERINGADTVDIGNGRRGFRDENLVSGISGTEVTAAFLNGTQEELLSVIEAAGLNPSNADWTQLLQALRIFGVDNAMRNKVWLAVMAVDRLAPPNNPDIGDAYLVPQGASGLWGNRSGMIVQWTGKGWSNFVPANGHGISLPDGRVFERIDGMYIEKLALDVQSGKWNTSLARGSANALEVSLIPSPSALPVGFSLNLVLSITNTANATLRLNGRPAVRVLDAEGKELSAGDLPAGEIVELIFDGTAFRTRQRSSRSNQLIGSNGWCQLPGGLIMQWGGFSGRTTNLSVNGVYESEGIQITWPIAFPNRILQAVGGCGTDVGGVGLQEQAWFVGAHRTGGTALVGARAPNETLSGSFILFGF